MTSSRRRHLNALLGGLGGLLAGLGLGVSLSQTGGLELLEAKSLLGIVVAILIGAVYGAVELPRLPKAALMSMTLAWPFISVGVLGNVSPAHAQVACTTAATSVVTIDGDDGMRLVDPTTATRADPLVLDLTETERIAFATQLDSNDVRGSMTVELTGVRPPFVSSSGPVYHGAVDGGRGEGTVTVGGRWPIRVEAADGVVAEAPLGRGRLDVTIHDGAGQVLCEQEVWVRFVAPVFAHPLGWAAAFAQGLGALAMAGALWRTPGLDPPIDRVHPIPVPETKLSICTVHDDLVVDPQQALAPGMDYRLDVSLGGKLAIREDDKTAAHVTTGAVDVKMHPLVEARSKFEVGLSFQTLDILQFDIRIPKPGKARILIDLLRRGGLMRTVGVDLIAGEGEVEVDRPATRGTTLLHSDPLPDDADVRAALFVLHPDAGQIGLRVLDANGGAIAEHRRLDGDALHLALLGGHDALEEAVSSTLSAEGLAALARAGQSIRELLIPTTGLLAEKAGAGAIVQMRFDPDVVDAGVPWNLIYDLDAPDGREARLCTSFGRHPFNTCPEWKKDARVVCPSGFWAWRYALEVSGPTAAEPATTDAIVLSGLDGAASPLGELAAGSGGEAAASLFADVRRRLVDGEKAGQALRLAGRDLLDATGSPLGLAYQLRARPDVRFANAGPER